MGLTATIQDHIFCPRLGEEEFEVTAMDDKHYELKSTKNSKAWKMYKAHCHLTHALIFANRRRRIERAEKIGRPKQKP